MSSRHEFGAEMQLKKCDGCGQVSPYTSEWASIEIPRPRGAPAEVLHACTAPCLGRIADSLDPKRANSTIPAPLHNPWHLAGLRQLRRVG